jgi:RHS repeat-associated protein
MTRAPKENSMNITLARGGLAALLVTLAATSCGGGSPTSGEPTGQSEQAVSLGIVLAYEVGRVVSDGNGLARTYNTYDARGRATGVEHVLDNAAYIFRSTYGFPCSGNACTAPSAATNGSVVVQTTFPDGEQLTYTFDAGDDAQSIVTTPSGGTAQTVVSRVLRNCRDQTVEVDYGDLTSTTHHYNDTTDLRLNQIETYLTATPTTLLQLYQYTFDPNGNVWSVTDYCNESATGHCSSSQENTTYSASYSYDSRDELAKAILGGAPYLYGYDSIGNLTNMEGTTQTYFASGANKPMPHALESVGPVSYQYDANGNTTGTTGATNNPTLAWDANNMPVTTAFDGQTTTKSFLGESMWKKVLGSTTTYYLPSMRVENGAFRKYYGSFAERDPGDVTGCTVNKADGCLKFYHADHLGSSTLVTDDASTVVHRQAYSPYGRDLVSPAPGPFTPKYQFNFKEKEADGSGFYDYGARVYNPATGRWLSPDSSTTDGLNRYTYVKNHPLDATDPTGHQQSLINQINDPESQAELRAGTVLFGGIGKALWNANARFENALNGSAAGSGFHWHIFEPSSQQQASVMKTTDVVALTYAGYRTASGLLQVAVNLPKTGYIPIIRPTAIAEWLRGNKAQGLVGLATREAAPEGALKAGSYKLNMPTRVDYAPAGYGTIEGRLPDVLHYHLGTDPPGVHNIFESEQFRMAGQYGFSPHLSGPWGTVKSVHPAVKDLPTNPSQ